LPKLKLPKHVVDLNLYLKEKLAEIANFKLDEIIVDDMDIKAEFIDPKVKKVIAIEDNSTTYAEELAKKSKMLKGTD